MTDPQSAVQGTKPDSSPTDSSPGPFCMPHCPLSTLTCGHTHMPGMTYRLDGFQQPDAELLDAAVGVGKLHESLTRCWLGLPHPDDGEHVPKGCRTSLP